MRYISTRGQAPPVSFLDSVLAGMAPDGGLYVPQEWPEGKGPGPRTCALAHYNALAFMTLSAFCGDDLQLEDAVAAANKAYVDAPKSLNDPAWRQKWPTAVTPLRQMGAGEWMLELFHGPSLSFKDVAMQLIAPLFKTALARRDQRLSVICATSGDTGGAAVQALKNCERIDLFVLTPRGRVSDVQRRFMTTSGAGNVHVAEVDGDFDTCQALVKALFADAEFAARSRLSAVNSINWARIVAQSVYFQLAAHILGAHGPVSFVVPTGNYGDAYSGWVAKRLGAPVGRIVLATNANDILVRALHEGRYRRGVSRATLSPAMDIQVASNFERILFEAMGRDGDAVRGLYERFAQSDGFAIPPEAVKRLKEEFSAASVDDAHTLQRMENAWTYEGELMCPHTAVGRAASPEPWPDAPIVYLATAHPAKFPDTVERATGVRPQLPARCADLFERQEKFDALPADVEAVKRYVSERSRAWS